MQCNEQNDDQADRFRISPEAVRRILGSKWEPSTAERTKMAKREREARERFWAERRAKEDRGMSGERATEMKCG